MCGITGIFNPLVKKKIDINILKAMCDKMIHRGPDAAGLWFSKDNRCGLGHRRLSIIDLSDSAAQPMSNQDGSVIIVFNGEIYNHQEIRHELQQRHQYHWQTDHSDTEVLLHAYEQWGVEGLDRLYGMFAFAIYDQRDPAKPKLHLVRDGVGIKPLYFCKTHTGEWLFSSEIRALFAHPDISPRMNTAAFWHYLTFIVTPAPLTLFENIWKLPAGFGITIDHCGDAKAWQWWDSKLSKQNTYTEKDLSFNEACDEVLNLLRKSIQRRMVSDVPFGVLLSGGVDSSLNVALMNELMDQPINTFTVGYETHDQFNEFAQARRVAKSFNTNHHETLISGKEALDFFPTLVELQDEPIADNVCIPLYFLARLVKQSGTTVVQVGEGADENFLGYWWCDHYLKKYQQVYLPTLKNGVGFRRWLSKLKHKMPLLSGEDQAIAARARHGQEIFWGGAVCWWGSMRNELTPTVLPFQQNLNCPVENLMPSCFASCDSHEIIKHYTDQLAELADPAILQKITYLEHKLRLPEHLLMRVDKMTMAQSVEARVPFLDKDVIDFAARLPLSYKINNGIGKKILKKVAEKFIDKELLYRRKQGFGAPMEYWFRETDFGKRCLNALQKSDLIKHGFFNKEYITGLLKKQVDGTLQGYSFHLWTVMNAVLWYEVWINDNSNCL